MKQCIMISAGVAQENSHSLILEVSKWVGASHTFMFKHIAHEHQIKYIRTRAPFLTAEYPLSLCLIKIRLTREFYFKLQWD